MTCGRRAQAWPSVIEDDVYAYLLPKSPAHEVLARRSGGVHHEPVQGIAPGIRIGYVAAPASSSSR